MTILRVLGSAAGGGFPQWNCNCRNCDGVRRGTVRATPRTQSSIALGDGQHNWIVVNASPDILAQLRASPALQPARTPRDTGIAGVVLIDAQIDHVTGLLMLREHRQALPLYASAAVLSDLSTAFPLTHLLSYYCGLDTHTLSLDGTAFSVPPLDDLALTAIPLESKSPPYSPSRNAHRMGDNIGLRIVARAAGAPSMHRASRVSSRTSSTSWARPMWCWSMAPAGATTRCSPSASPPRPRPTWATSRNPALAA